MTIPACFAVRPHTSDSFCRKRSSSSGVESLSPSRQSAVRARPRVLRIKTGEAHAEVPPSTTQRLITNITVEPAAAEESLRVRSNFMVYQERRGQHGVTFFGKRDDVLRQVDGAFKISLRRIDLAQKLLPTTISIFF
jgi:3-phenylpropionate/cinnamic acid dioxygenase small subunit